MQVFGEVLLAGASRRVVVLGLDSPLAAVGLVCHLQHHPAPVLFVSPSRRQEALHRGLDRLASLARFLVLPTPSGTKVLHVFFGRHDWAGRPEKRRVVVVVVVVVMPAARGWQAVPGFSVKGMKVRKYEK